MNWDQVEGKWKQKQMNGAVKEKWGKLTDDDLDVIAGKKRQADRQAQRALWHRSKRSRKAVSIHELMERIHSVVSPEPPMDGAAGQTTPSNRPVGGHQRLSVREKEVVGLIRYGLKNSEIAERLSISVATVKHHVNNIFVKLGISDRLELLLWAIHNAVSVDIGMQERNRIRVGSKFHIDNELPNWPQIIS